MARLLAAAEEAGLRPPPPAAEASHRPAAPAARAEPGPEPAGPVAPAPFTTVDVRPVHVAEPEAEPEPEDTAPPTLEALAARFGSPQPEEGRPVAPVGVHQAAKSARDRSKKEREKQAAILARLRSGQSS
jgi:hypothetical protein